MLGNNVHVVDQMIDVEPARNADVRLVVGTGEEDGHWLVTSNTYKSHNVASQAIRFYRTYYRISP